MRYSVSLALSLVASTQAFHWPIPFPFPGEPNAPGCSESYGGHATCITREIPVAASVLNEKLLTTNPANQLALTEAFVEYLQINSTLSEQVNGGMQKISGTFNINARLCIPKHTKLQDLSTIEFLIHGIGFDHTYWDLAVGYSYIDAAAAAGYATFSYDRLGTGKSAHPDPINTVQSYLETEIAHQLIQSLRSGAVGGHKFSKVVGIGHSFGSIQSVGIANQYPKDLDAIVLTGFTTSMGSLPLTIAGWNLAIAAQNQPRRFGNLPTGYIVTDTSISNSLTFYRYPNFDPDFFYSLDAKKQPLTIGVAFTLSSVVKPAPSFTGPIDVVNGENDFIFCQSDCNLPYDQSAAVKGALFTGASSGSQYITLPGVGHAIFSHYAAPKAFAQIINFIKANGIKP